MVNINHLLRKYIMNHVWSFNLQTGKYYDISEYVYQQCAVTKEHSIPALEAAHIKPYNLGGFHEVNNVLLLRADIHKLEYTPSQENLEYHQTHIFLR